MKIGRREFMSSISSLAILATAKDALAGVSERVSSKGNLQINTYNLQAGNAYPFVNMFLANDRPWQYTDQASHDGYAYIGSDGYPTSIPDAGQSFTTFVIPYYALGDTWTISWTGAGTVSLEFIWAGFNVSSSGTNPRVYTFTLNTAGISNWNSGTSYSQDYTQISSFVKGSDGNYYFCNTGNTNKDPTTDNGCYWTKVTTGFSLGCRVRISALPVAAIKLYRTSNGVPSTPPDYSNFFDPQLLSAYGGFGVVRFIQWGAIINSPVSQWSNRSRLNTYSAIGSQLNNDPVTGNWYVGSIGAPTGNLWAAPTAPSSAPSAWADKMQFAAYMNGSYLSFSNVTAITNANPCKITSSAAHGLVNGDVAVFSEGHIVSATPSKPATYNSANAYNAGQLVISSSATYMAVVNMSAGTAPTPVTDNGTHWTQISGSSPGSNTIGALLEGAGGHTITKIDATNFTVALDSSTWGTYTSGGEVSKQPTFSVPGLPGTKPIWYAACSAMNQNYTNHNLNQLWLFTYDAEFDVVLAQVLNQMGAGWAIEAQVAFCNALNCNGWFGIPHLADDTYVTNMATYIRDHLNPGLVAYYELSNEIWNGIWFETPYASVKAAHYAKNGTHGWTGPLPNYHISGYLYYDYYWYGWRFYNVATNIKTVYAGKLNQCNCVLAHAAKDYGAVNRNLYIDDPAINGKNMAVNCNTAAPPCSVADSVATSSYLRAVNPSADNTVLSAQMVWQYCYGGLQATALASFDAYWRSTQGPTDTENLYSYVANGFPHFAYMAKDPATDGSVSAKTPVQYEGGLGSYPAFYKFDVNPYNPGSGPVTLNGGDILNLFWGYYESTYAQKLLNQDPNVGTSSLQAWKSATASLPGKKYPSLYPLNGLWGGNGAFGANSGTEWSPTWPQLKAWQNYNNTGSP